MAAPITVLQHWKPRRLRAKGACRPADSLFTKCARARRLPETLIVPGVLVARAAEARDVLPEALRERGAKVDVVALYRTVAEEPDAAAVDAARDADYVTFTSASTVRNFIDASGGRLPERARIVSIGPVTSEAVRQAGLTVDVEAQRHDPEGLIEALMADASGD